jgi:hypothetical protein
MDVNCGTILDGEETVQQCGERIFDLMLKTASGQPTKSETFDFGGAEFSPWVLGATMWGARDAPASSLANAGTHNHRLRFRGRRLPPHAFDKSRGMGPRVRGGDRRSWGATCDGDEYSGLISAFGGVADKKRFAAGLT